MQLLLVADRASVVVLNDVESVLNQQNAVALNQIPTVLAAIRSAAVALIPPDLTPRELDESYPLIVELAQRARNLSAAAPAADADAQAIMDILDDLRIATVKPPDKPPVAEPVV